MRKLFCKHKNSYFSLEEDVVGWYLIVYEDENMKSSREDHLFDNIEEALQVAKEDFGIPKSNWKEDRVN